jgi:hypothetical protein
MASRDFMKIVSFHVQRSVKVDECRVVVTMDVRYKANQSAQFEMYYPLRDERHLVSLLKYVDTDQSPEYHLSRAMVEVIFEFLEGIKEEI